MKPTADLYDEHGDDLQSCTTQFRLFGARTSFEGVVTTVRCHEDNVILKATLGEPGAGRVLVVDGGGSLAAALMGDLIADLGASSGWEGVVINGAVRDVEALSKINLGVKALGSNPRKSRKEGVGDRDVEVSFGGVTFTPGCHLYSDTDGILVTRA
ncbi:ribonuclease E activity regulator RraA [Streptomyces phaeochromogenes]|uniref:ribonuclease E activity regulator RraA n=1 Tax=Streptomyces phaeochromogenes TaxID=1923 RepID=UPI002E13BF2D|nr:ribonuclease E activity regulator RraA [Streptomyces phaeochromogenes]WSJ02682.1 ribonuclease E activity regulator RraA [Streptomyces phaeochromogenes]WSS98905.1 ribonuclease E activity regulator RraA [Streptomyces phaeochromogenes]WSW12003.1 ribonuclease E activity regulator RraA [Streptomyces phaeochromogenes]